MLKELIIAGLLVWLAGPVCGQEAGSVAVPDSLAAEVEAAELPDTVAIEELPPDYWSTGVSSTAAVLMTPLFPGWGQLYTDNSWKAALAFGLEMFYWSNMLTRDRRAVRARQFSETFAEGDPNRTLYNNIAEENWEQMRDFAWWSGGVLLIIALDSYVGAHLFNFDAEPVPVPNEWDEQFGGPGGDFPTQVPGPTIVVFQQGWKF